MIYLTSDLHFNHDKSFVWQERGFRCVEEMDEGLVKRFNTILTDDDTLYILGDCCMGLNDISMPYLEKIKGHKRLIIGNHDSTAKIAEYQNRNIFESIEFGDRIKYHKRWFILSHYPMLVGNASNEKIWNLHGHTHQKHHFGSVPQCYHVGVDAHDCYPISIEKIYNDIKETQAQ